MKIVQSKNDVPIRLPKERWLHIIEEHDEMKDLQDQVLNTIANPEQILEGQQNAQIAVSQITNGKYIIAIYKELEGDGFIITAFLTRKVEYLNRRKRLWP